MDDGEARALDRPSGERRSKQVLDAAEACMRRLGFHNCSMSEIAAAAGMSVGHIYRYFPSKEAIIIAIVQRDMADAAREIEAIECDTRCLRTALMAHVQRVIKRLTQPERIALSLEIMAEAARNPRIAEVVRDGVGEVHGRLFDLVNGSRAPNLTEADLRERMDVFDLILAGLAMKSVKTPDFDREATAAHAAQCIASMVAAPKADAP